MHSGSQSCAVLLVDSHELRGAGLMKLLAEWASQNGVRIVAKKPDEVVSELSEHNQYDMIIISLGGESVASKVKASEVRIMKALAPDARLVVMSDLEETNEIQTALQLGAEGYIPSGMQPNLALEALSFILRGGSYFPHDVIRHVLKHSAEAPTGGESEKVEDHKQTLPAANPRPARDTNRNGTPHGPASPGRMPELTQRQNEVLSLLSEGLANKVIARSLGMTEATVKVHVRQIMRKFGVDNRTQAALCAITALRETRNVVSNGVTDIGRRSAVTH